MSNAVSLKDDLLNSDAIVGIRLVAKGSASHCPLCGNFRAEPWRRYHGGVVAEGCIDASHTEAMFARLGHADRTGIDSEWHFRECARNLRAGWLKSLRGKAGV